MQHHRTLDREGVGAIDYGEHSDIIAVRDNVKISKFDGELETMQIHYIEIVTHEVDATCATQEKLHGVTFGEGEPGLGNARTAILANGGMIGVRAPMHESEEAVVRPYLLVKNIDSAVETAMKTGGEIAHPPMEIPGYGKFAIYIQGGIQYGLWQM